MKWLKEIKAVGFKDWFWFVFIIKRDEFHRSLATSSLIIVGGTVDELIKKRNRAHRIDEILSPM